MAESIIAAIIAAGVPSIAITTLFTYILHKREKREDEQRKAETQHEESRRKFELLQIQGTLASMALGEATATAIKNGHSNGETEKALQYEQEVKHEIRNFLAEQGVNSVS